MLGPVAVAQVATSVNPSGLGVRQYAIDTVNSAKRIREVDKMYQISVWRRIDLREKYNLPLYGSGQSRTDGIMNHIYKAVKSNQLPVFSDEGLSKAMSIAEFDSTFWLNANSDSILGPRDLYYFDFREDFVFDRQHSQFKFDIKYIQLVMPSEVFLGGKQKNIAFIRYKDFIKYFENHPEAKWINFKNIAEPKSYSEAFEGRLFRSVVTRYTNEFDATVYDLIDQRYTRADQLKMKEFLDALAFEYKLLEFESSVWEW
jgi:gliding motility associated protien GldN